MSPFQYKPLGDSEFRILTVYAGAENAPLRCSITNYAGEQYDALSWCWGDEPEDAFVQFLNPETKEPTPERALIKPSLELALRSLRKNTEPQAFWVDALCMDLANKQERAGQVKIMNKIYRQARQVCIWLGQEDEQSGRAITFVKDHISNLRAFDQLTQDEVVAEDWSAFGALMTKPWFSRRWIIQEIAYAKKATVCCGKRSVSWYEFETAVALFARDAPNVSKIFRGLRKFNNSADFFGDVPALEACRLVHVISNVFGKSDNGEISDHFLSLEELISSLSPFEAKEPHDIFYAVLSLAKDVLGQMKTSETTANLIHQIRPDSNVQQEDQASSQSQARKRPIEELAEGTDDAAKRQKTVAPGGPVQEPMQSSMAPPLHNASTVGTNRASEVELWSPTSASRPGFSRASSASTSALTSSELKRSTLGSIVLQAVKHLRRPKSKDEKRIFDVDYTQPFIEVCRQFLEFVIPRSGSLDVVLRPWAPLVQGQAFPSWVPTLDRTPYAPRRANVMAGLYKMNRRNPDPLVGQSGLTRQTYNAWPGQKVSREDWGFEEISTQRSNLFVTGFVLDTIGQAEESSQHGNIPETWLQLGRWNASRARHRTVGPPPDEFWRTLVAARAQDGSAPPVYWRSACEYALTQSSDGDGMQTSNIIEHGSSIITAEFLQRVQAVIWNRKLFRTRNDGILGLASKAAEEGDCK